MKIGQFIILFILVLCFTSYVKTQVCGPSKTKIFIRDTKGNDIEDVKIEFPYLDSALPEFKGNWLKYSENAYVISFPTYKPYGEQKIKFSAKGFEPSFQTIHITEAQFQVFELILKPEKSNEKSIFREFAVFRGTVVDTNGGFIPQTKIKLIDENGSVKEVTNGEDQYFEIVIPSGKYQIELVGQKGFAPKKYKDFDLTKGHNYLEVILDVRPCDDCHWIEGKPVKKDIKPN